MIFVFALTCLEKGSGSKLTADALSSLEPSVYFSYRHLPDFAMLSSRRGGSLPKTILIHHVFQIDGFEMERCQGHTPNDHIDKFLMASTLPLQYGS